MKEIASFLPHEDITFIGAGRNRGARPHTTGAGGLRRPAATLPSLPANVGGVGKTVFMDVVVKGLIIAACGVIALVANPLIRLFLRKIEPKTPKADERLLSVERKLPGGRWIGVLERAGVYACLVAGFPAGLAFIIAIKGLGRYPELRAQADPRVGELFIIGTFASMLWAAAFAGIAYWVVRLW